VLTVKPDARVDNRGLLEPGDLPTKAERTTAELFRLHRGRLRLAGLPTAVLRQVDEMEPRT